MSGRSRRGFAEISAFARLRPTAESHDGAISKLVEAARQDGENIRALARIAEAHEHRSSNLEGPEEV
jgi:hypothetical protein